MNKQTIQRKIRCGEWLQRIRPAPLASLIKRLLGIKRVPFPAVDGVFHIDPASNFGLRLLKNGVYEPETRDALKQILQPGFRVVDLGANEGYFSILASQCVGPEGSVLAIDPQDRLAAVLERNIELNQCSNITVFPGAISDYQGQAELHLLPDLNTGGSSLAQITRYRTATQTTPLCTLEHLLSKKGWDHVDLIKIDIEGWEWEALFGSRNLFQSGAIAGIYLELHHHLLKRRGLDPNQLLEFLHQAGYSRDPHHPEYFRYQRLE